MSQHKTWVGRALANIVGFFGSIFHSVMKGAEKTFDELPQETKDALIHGSGIMDVINGLLDGTPDEIRAAIAEKFPDVSPVALEAGLFAVAHGFNLLPNENDLNDCINKLKEYLKNLHGNVWDAIMHAGASILAIVFAPAGTKFGAITSLLEWVYQTFIKKDK